MAAGPLRVGLQSSGAPMIPPEPGTLDLSAVVPVHNEIESLDPLIGELRSALDASRRSWEIVLVDDASTDGSGERIRAAAAKDPRVHGVLLWRRGGQSTALVAGLARARGRVIVTLDADLQNDPADLPKLLDALERADVASGVRVGRQDTAARRWSSHIANVVRRSVLGDSISDIGCSFKAYRRETLVALPAFAGVHRFLPALCQFRGARVEEVRVTHRPRRYGVSKYGVSDRMWRGLYDLAGVRWLKSRLIDPATQEEGS
jgi:glycosyltransferase involved in cell wall biosynthesis